jgi:hypothetical protein
MHRVPIPAFVFSQDSCVVNNFGVTCCSCILRVLSSASTQKNLWKKHPARSMHHNGSMHPWEALPEVWKRLPLSAGCQRRAPWEAVLENSGAPTINAKKCQWWASLEVLPLSPGAPTINTRKHRRWALWRVLTEIRERPPSTLKNIDDGPPGRCCQRI